ncbi:hypothetical protein PR048_011486 [Dryococelus australis]|uniref:Uncharacterized protein n=1 Tax=Dryococelus australis TaxID=614101 RepID=A0ABQ9HLQ9_9NEOP|nr:hypothetical protein PR048_011486 [Dryococelus australis]
MIDWFSKFVWAMTNKSKCCQKVARAMSCILHYKGAPQICQIELGCEFYNLEFTSLMKKHNSYKWLNISPGLVSVYNHTLHHMICMNTIDVKANALLHMVVKSAKIIDRCKHNVKIGNYVRISQKKNIFDKGYSQPWLNTLMGNPYEVIFILKKYNPLRFTLLTSINKKNTVVRRLFICMVVRMIRELRWYPWWMAKETNRGRQHPRWEQTPVPPTIQWKKQDSGRKQNVGHNLKTKWLMRLKNQMAD